MTQSTNEPELICCSDCDHLIVVPALSEQQYAECPRCHNILKTTQGWSLRRCAILALSILILMPFALHSPLISIHLLRDHIDASVWQGVWKMATQGYQYSAFLVFLCAVFIPIAFALLVVGLRLAEILKIKPSHLLFTLGYIKPWVMLDVYLISLFVTMFKVREYADLSVNIHIIAFILTALLTTLLFIQLNPQQLWRRFYPQIQAIHIVPEGQETFFCKNCEHTFLEPHFNAKHIATCPRCRSKVKTPETTSLQPVWATLIAGIIMLFPANLLPISVVYLNGVANADTLMSGVLSFMEAGNYAIALIVFVASIFVPMSKVAIMLYLLICVHFQLKHSIKWQMRLLHFVHFIGRWSMLDLFVLALMMSLVSRGQIIDFSVGPAAFYFGMAVFFSMISSSLFDSRLIWKIYDKSIST